MRLYELTAEYEKAFTDLFDPDTGEVNEQAMERMDGLQGDINEKGKAVAFYIRNYSSAIRELREEENRLAKRRRGFQSQMEWFRGYLLENMVRSGISQIKSPFFTVSTRKCPPRPVVVDEGLVPQEYIKVVEMVSVDMEKVKQDICSGIEVPGCRLEQATTITIK